MFGTYLRDSWKTEVSFSGWEDVPNILSRIKDLQIDNLESMKRKDCLELMARYKELNAFMRQTLDDLCIYTDLDGEHIL